MQKTETTMTPGEHTRHMATMLQQAQQECRADIGRVDDPKAQALFETVAEVLGGLMKANETSEAFSLLASDALRLRIAGRGFDPPAFGL